MVKKNSIKDVAKKAGVSIATVSYVLNGKHSDRISEQTKDKIKQAIIELEYHPNKIARSLKTNRSKILGFVLADITNPFFSELAQLVENEAMKMGYTVLIGSADEDAAKFDQLIQLFLQQQIEGLILAPVEGCEHTIAQLDVLAFPFVFIDRFLKDFPANFVGIDNYTVSKNIAKDFELKNKKFPLVVSYDTQLQHLIDRRNGFMEGITLNCSEVKVRTDFIHDDVWNGLSTFWDQDVKRPDCIYFTSNKLAFEGLKYFIFRHHEKIKDLEIIAFDKSIAYELYAGNIAFVEQPLKEMANKTLQILQNKIEDKTMKSEINNILLKAHLVLKKIEKF